MTRRTSSTSRGSEVGASLPRVFALFLLLRFPSAAARRFRTPEVEPTMNALPRPVAAIVVASVVLAVALTGSVTTTGSPAGAGTRAAPGSAKTAGSAAPAVTGAAGQTRAEQTVARIAVRAGLQVGPKHTSRP